jgi:hypothetical protein
MVYHAFLGLFTGFLNDNPVVVHVKVHWVASLPVEGLKDLFGDGYGCGSSGLSDFSYARAFLILYTLQQ